VLFGPDLPANLPVAITQLRRDKKISTCCLLASAANPSVQPLYHRIQRKSSRLAALD